MPLGIGPGELLIIAVAVMICLGPVILAGFLVIAYLRNRNMAPGDYPSLDRHEPDITTTTSREPDPYARPAEPPSDAALAELSERLTRIERRLEDLEQTRDPFR